MKANTAMWRESFGDAYTERNSDARIYSRLALFAKILRSARDVRSIVEIGCNKGPNLQAINTLDPTIALTGYEINETAAQQAVALEIATIHCQDVLSLNTFAPSDLAFTSGVLIHIPPEHLGAAYKALHGLSRRYVLVCEYYNPTPVSVPYRGSELYKRDFAGELMDRFDLTLRDYGFVYHRDTHFPLDDATWFLLEKWA